ncbi:MAG: sigma 54-interacting transcriptional regulator [Burkholderiales bacterium]|jgi:two-component system response regulator GlrR
MTVVFHKNLTLKQLFVIQALAEQTGWSVYDCPKTTSWLSLLDSKSVPMVVLADSAGPILADIASIRRVVPATPIFVWLSDDKPETSMQLIQAGVSNLIAHDASHQTIERTLKPVTKTATASRQVLCAHSARTKALASSIDLLALGDSDVLISGPSGSGKELCASLIHKISRRANKPMVVLNCPALPVDLADAELFGHVKNAFTGATREKPGLIREAEGGILLLDEVAALPLSLQAKMLRVIQEREVRPVGSGATVKVDIRILSTTNQDLPALVAAGHFREDLLYRLSVKELRVPPLRERLTDIAALARKFASEFNGDDTDRNVMFGDGCLAMLARGAWPGNVRQLRSVVRSAAALADDGRIEQLHLEDLMDGSSSDSIQQLVGLSRVRADPIDNYLRMTLRQCANDYRAAAAIADIHMSSLYRLMPPEKALELIPHG